MTLPCSKSLSIEGSSFLPPFQEESRPYISTTVLSNLSIDNDKFLSITLVNNRAEIIESGN